MNKLYVVEFKHMKLKLTDEQRFLIDSSFMTMILMSLCFSTSVMQEPKAELPSN